MGNVIDSFFSGFAKVVGKLFGSPLDFLAGKSCSSVCGSTWDFICFIENFCVANLLKMAMVFVLLYTVLLFFYLLHKLGICECVSRSLCRMLWTCSASCLYYCEFCCTFMWVKLHSLRRTKRRRKIDIEVFDASTEPEEDDDYDDENDGSFSCRSSKHKEKSSFLCRRRRDYGGAQLRKSLRPRSHRIRAGISRDLAFGNRRKVDIKRGDHHDHDRDHDAIRVTRTSKFVRKGTIVHRKRKR